jgi:ubiquinone/menaquinone biosynthesis C-methylase UbiE
VSSAELTKTTPQAKQREYYERTATEYDEAHVTEEPEHNLALRYISALLPSLGVENVLDVGCGTGRGVRELRSLHPGLSVFGIEPVEALLKVGIAKGIPPSCLMKGDARTLPFADASFDAVMELGILHHVERPDIVVREMLRVAKKAVFISDSNLFGQGRKSVRVVKFILYKAGLWSLAKFIQTAGNGYTITDGDGLAYSYSAYFQHGLLVQWADRVISVPLMTDAGAASSLLPPLDSRSILLCAVRDSIS